jgi:hypothetical protein
MSDHNSIDRILDRQTRILFYSATLAAILSASVALLGVGEIVTGNPHGTETMLGGLKASVESIKIAQSVRDRVKNSSNRSIKTK